MSVGEWRWSEFDEGQEKTTKKGEVSGSLKVETINIHKKASRGQETFAWK